MPRIKAVETTANYNALRQGTFAKREQGDCAVIAVAMACNVSYEDAHTALARYGRKFGQGTPTHIIWAAMRALGKDVRALSSRQFINEYPRPHNTLRGVTSHHPRRFAKVWKDGQTYLFLTASHILACVDGQVHDWSVNRALRVNVVYQVIDLPAKPVPLIHLQNVTVIEEKGGAQ